MPGRKEQPPEHDRNGWEAIAAWFTDYGRKSTVGMAVIQRWAEMLPPGGSVLDLGCGPGTPRSQALANRGFALYAIDASPTLVAAYQTQFSNAHVECAPVEDSSFFGQRFDGVLAWGLMFLLPTQAQRELIHHVAKVLHPGGAFLFTAPAQECKWDDQSTGQPSRSLGASVYRKILAEAGLILRAEYNDEGENHYYDVVRA